MQWEEEQRNVSKEREYATVRVVMGYGGVVPARTGRDVEVSRRHNATWLGLISVRVIECCSLSSRSRREYYPETVWLRLRVGDWYGATTSAM